MEKIFQILVVFALMLLLISWFIKGKDPRYRPYDYIMRIKPPLPESVAMGLVPAVFGEVIAGLPVEGQSDAVLTDAVNGLLFIYSNEGRLTIFRRNKQMQELAVPLQCTAIALDPADGKLYFETGGYLFVYGMI